MGLNVSQIASNMGIISRSQREAENEVMRQRQLELQTQELNQLQRMRADMARDAVNLAGGAAPMQFAQTPGAQFGNPEAPAPQTPTVTPPPIPTGAGTTPAAAPVAARPPATPARPPAAPAAPAAGLRTPQQLASVPTDQLTAAEFQALPQQERLRRLQTENDRRKLSRIDTAVAAPPAAAFDIAALPFTAAAKGVESAANAMNFARFGRAIGLYDPDVTSVTVPGSGSITPFTDRLRRSDAENQPVTEAQLLERLKTGEATRAQAAQQKLEADMKAAPQTFSKLEEKYKLPAGLLNAVMMAESGGRPGQTSSAGAQGYFQFMPDTAKQYKVKVNDLNSEADGAARMLRDLLKMSGGDLPTALAGYNWGIGNVQRQGMDKMPAETRNYIPKVMSALSGAQQTQAPQQTQTPQQTVVAAVQTGTPQDVATAVVESVKPAAGGTMYGAATIDASARNPVIQQTLQLRQVLQNQVNTYARYGRGDLALETAAKIQAIDLGLYKSQADIGLYEGATTGNFSRAMSVLSTFTGAPHQVLQRSDGKGFDLYINGQVSKAGLSGDQIEMLVRTQVDSEYRKQLASVQSARGQKRFETDEAIRQETAKQVSTQTLQTAREVQLEVIKGNVKLAEKKLEMAGFKAVSSGAGDGKVTYSNGLGEFFVIDTVNKEIEVNGTKVTVGPQAQRAAGIDTRSIWSSVNAPKQ